MLPLKLVHDARPANRAHGAPEVPIIEQDLDLIGEVLDLIGCRIQGRTLGRDASLRKVKGRHGFTHRHTVHCLNHGTELVQAVLWVRGESYIRHREIAHEVFNGGPPGEVDVWLKL